MATASGRVKRYLCRIYGKAQLACITGTARVATTTVIGFRYWIRFIHSLSLSCVTKKSYVYILRRDLERTAP